MCRTTVGDELLHSATSTLSPPPSLTPPPLQDSSPTSALPIIEDSFPHELDPGERAARKQELLNRLYRTSDVDEADRIFKLLEGDESDGSQHGLEAKASSKSQRSMVSAETT